MKIAIIHYHLNRGGVTQVIANHLRVLNGQTPPGARMPVALFYGGRCDGWPEALASELDRLEISWHTIGELDYDNVRPRQADLGEQLQSALQKAEFRPQETVLHVHNHSLGKNVALPGAVSRLACAGYALLLHIHDFAEDFRPNSYRQLASALCENKFDKLPVALYPQAPHVHYAVLNGRDHAILREAKIDDARLHLLPNAVADVGPLPPRHVARAKLADRFGVSASDQFVLYPVRGIRRKNLGEALLWSALAGRKTCFGLTLPPLNPLEQPSYARWKELATAIDLPWIFEVGGATGLDYADNLAAADAILTTSVAEGFGLVFLECWLAGRPLIGRDLPEITADFVAAGIRFQGLKPNLFIPMDWLNEEAFRAEIAVAYQKVLALFGQPLPPPNSLGRDIDGLVHDGLVDFGSCDVSTQRQVIEQVAGDESSRQRLLAMNPWVERALSIPDADPSIIAHNAEIVRSKYSVASCGHRLTEIYRHVAASDRDDVLKPPARSDRILAGFLGLSRFHPVRVES